MLLSGPGRMDSSHRRRWCTVTRLVYVDQIAVAWPRYVEQNCRKEVLQHHRAGVFGAESVLWSFQLMLLKCCFTSTETVGLLAIGAQDGHLDFHTVPELCSFHMDRIVLYRI